MDGTQLTVEVPAKPTDFAFAPLTTAVVVVDMQNDFAGATIGFQPPDRSPLRPRLVSAAGLGDELPVPYGPICDTPVERAAMVHWWDELTFLHWWFEPVAVQRLLPEGLTVETMDDVAWVGLVPFFLRVGLPRVPSVPWLSRFAETNVRTYVRSADGARGIWFFSLDAARLGAVVTARSTYRLPYFWSSMSIERAPSRILVPLPETLARPPRGPERGRRGHR